MIKMCERPDFNKDPEKYIAKMMEKEPALAQAGDAGASAPAVAVPGDETLATDTGHEHSHEHEGHEHP